MILVDSSVWISYLRGADSPEIARLDDWLGQRQVAIGDLILVEVLQGVASDREYMKTKERLASLRVFNLAGSNMAIRAAENFRELRKLGITVRKTIDTIIATFCIHHGHSLLFSDRDFDPFVEHLGLRSAMHSH
jgi:predicted nucleic acid-binding protein